MSQSIQNIIIGLDFEIDFIEFIYKNEFNSYLILTHINTKCLSYFVKL